jgi:hypothetical protein
MSKNIDIRVAHHPASSRGLSVERRDGVVNVWPTSKRQDGSVIVRCMYGLSFTDTDAQIDLVIKALQELKASR